METEKPLWQRTHHVFVWNHLSDDADLHPYRNENTDSLDTISNFERRNGGTSYTGRPLQ
jgi:hypothetical protein